MKYMGVDYGTKRIGISISDARGVIAFPHAILTHDGGGAVVRELADFCTRELIDAIVVGESRNRDGGHNRVHHEAERFATLLEDVTGLPIYFEWEGYTSAQAKNARRAEGAARGDIARKVKQPREHVDDSAAAIMLQSYLDKLQT